MHRGFGKDQVEPPVIRRLWKPIQQLERISQTGSDGLRPDGGQRSIEITATTAEPLSDAAESHPGDTEQCRPQITDWDDFCPLRFQQAEHARSEFGAVPDADYHEFTKLGNDPGQKNASPRPERVREQQVSSNLVVLGRVEDDRPREAVERGFEEPELHAP